MDVRCCRWPIKQISIVVDFVFDPCLHVTPEVGANRTVAKCCETQEAIAPDLTNRIGGWGSRAANTFA